jgi:hypothetical protein
MKTEIYVLKDENGKVRYVGKSSHSAKKRYSRHLAEARDGLKTHKARWIKGMLNRGFVPQMDIIDTVEGDGCESEKRWIAFFKEQGVKLTNLTDGGEGVTGYKHSDELKAKRCQILKAYWSDKDHHSKGVKMSDESRAKMSNTRKGKKLSAEHKAKLSASKKGKKFTRTHIENLKKSHSGPEYKGNGRVFGEETKLKISESIKKAHKDGRCAAPQRNKNGMFVAA